MPQKAKFKFLPHTADVLVEAYGKTLEEALENLALGLFETLAEREKLEEKKSVQIMQEASNAEELAALTLGDLLSESDARELFFKSFKVEKLEQKGGGYQLKGTARGETRSRAKGRTDVKAVTFHESVAKQGAKGEWTLRVLLDI